MNVILAKIFDIKIIDAEDFTELIFRFAFNLIVSLIIVRSIYYPSAKKKEYLFTFLALGTITFFLCHLLSNVKLGLGFALGLFAIFGIIRYRTNPIPIKEMTYLFLVIGMSVINGLANKKVSYVELLFTNVAMLTLIYFLNKLVLLKGERKKIITYEKIELIKPENNDKLLSDLKERTGLNIHRVEVGRIDFLKDTAQVRVFYYDETTSE
ncbi:MAG: DUF4956 domain-containing protein [Flavobacteriales bacterium]|nr:DUF4956 domain-containing protein [Flavobacteriales bacterium]